MYALKQLTHVQLNMTNHQMCMFNSKNYFKSRTIVTYNNRNIPLTNQIVVILPRFSRCDNNSSDGLSIVWIVNVNCLDLLQLPFPGLDSLQKSMKSSVSTTLYSLFAH